MIPARYLCLLLFAVMLVIPQVGATTTIFYLPQDSADQQVTRAADANWTTMRNATGDATSDGSFTTYGVQVVSAASPNGQYSQIKRLAYGFNTSSIPDGAVITSTIFSVYPSAKLNDLGDYGVGITGFVPANSPGSFTAADYDKFNDTRYAADVSYASIPENTTYLNFTFNEDGLSHINKTGFTNFMIRETSDIEFNESRLTWAASKTTGVKFYDYTEIADRQPILTITYETDTPSAALGYYAYGDSITRATGGDDLATDGTDVYVTQMVKAHDATNTSDNNLDGGSKTSAWGLANFYTHGQYEGTEPERVFIMFGDNDGGSGIFGLTRAANLAGIYNGYTANGTKAYVIIPPLVTPNGKEWNIYTNQYSNITIIQDNLTERGIPFVKIYDAIDSDPNNGDPDEVNASLLYDHIHPNKEGHRLMGEFLWDYLESEGGGPIAPVASFTTNVTSGTVPLAVQFTDSSTNSPTTWNWSFGDGNWSNGTASVVSYLYEYSGTYNAFLIASNGGGSSTSATTTITVNALPVSLQCQNQTGNITIQLFSNSTSSLGWSWNFTQNITQIAEDGLFVTNFDNSSNYFIGTGYLPETWHKLKIYNATDFGQLNCTTDAIPVTPTPIPIMPSTESTAGTFNPIQYWWVGAGALGLIILFREW